MEKRIDESPDIRNKIDKITALGADAPTNEIEKIIRQLYQSTYISSNNKLSFLLEIFNFDRTLPEEARALNKRCGEVLGISLPFLFSTDESDQLRRAECHMLTEQWKDTCNACWAPNALLSCVSNSKRAHMVGCLDHLVPMSLKCLSENCDASVQSVGAQCVRHIVNECPPTDVRWFAEPLWAEVRRAVQSTREHPLMDQIFDCAVDVVKILESDDCMGSKHVDLFSDFLSCLQLRADNHSVTAAMRHVAQLISHMNVYSARFFKALFPLLVEHSRSSEPAVCASALECVRAITTDCWPRALAHENEILEATHAANATPALATDPTIRALSSEIVQRLDVLRSSATSS